MFKSFLIGFIVLVLLVAIVLYGYGKRVMSNMSSPKVDEYVEETTVVPSDLNWIDYSPNSKKFSAKFPALPRQAKEHLTDIKTKETKEYEIYVNETDGKIFMISVIAALNSAKDQTEDAMLNDLVNNMVAANPSNKLESIRHGLFDGHKDVDFVITNPYFVMKGKAVADNEELYVLTSITRNAGEGKSEYNYFVNSFKLKNSAPIGK